LQIRRWSVPIIIEIRRWLIVYVVKFDAISDRLFVIN